MIFQGIRKIVKKLNNFPSFLLTHFKNIKINVLCAEPPFLVISICLGEEHLNNGG